MQTPQRKTLTQYMHHIEMSLVLIVKWCDLTSLSPVSSSKWMINEINLPNQVIKSSVIAIDY